MVLCAVEGDTEWRGYQGTYWPFLGPALVLPLYGALWSGGRYWVEGVPGDILTFPGPSAGITSVWCSVEWREILSGGGTRGHTDLSWAQCWYYLCMMLCGVEGDTEWRGYQGTYSPFLGPALVFPLNGALWSGGRYWVEGLPGDILTFPGPSAGITPVWCSVEWREILSGGGTRGHTDLSWAQRWYFLWMVLCGVEGDVKLRYWVEGVPGDIIWLRSICIWCSYSFFCFSKASGSKIDFVLFSWFFYFYLKHSSILYHYILYSKSWPWLLEYIRICIDFSHDPSNIFSYIY